MSAYSGSQGKGASKARQTVKRASAEQRQATQQPISDTDQELIALIHGETSPFLDRKRGVKLTEPRPYTIGS